MKVGCMAPEFGGRWKCKYLTNTFTLTPKDWTEMKGGKGGGKANRGKYTQCEEGKIKKNDFLPEIIAYSFASVWNPRVRTHVMPLGHTNLCYYKAKNKTAHTEIEYNTETFFKKKSIVLVLENGERKWVNYKLEMHLACAYIYIYLMPS